jgi:hypothetical protein
MPLTQPERDNPLMRRYFDEIGLPGKRLAERCGVSHSQIYMARNRNVGATLHSLVLAVYFHEKAAPEGAALVNSLDCWVS